MNAMKCHQVLHSPLIWNYFLFALHQFSIPHDITTTLESQIFFSPSACLSKWPEWIGMFFVVFFLFFFNSFLVKLSKYGHQNCRKRKHSTTQNTTENVDRKINAHAQYNRCLFYSLHWNNFFLLLSLLSGVFFLPSFCSTLQKTISIFIRTVFFFFSFLVVFFSFYYVLVFVKKKKTINALQFGSAHFDARVPKNCKKMFNLLCFFVDSNLS